MTQANTDSVVDHLEEALEHTADDDVRYHLRAALQLLADRDGKE